MNNLIKSFILCSSLIAITSCTTDKQNKSEEHTEINIIGKQATIEYPDFRADMTYSSDSVLHWKTTAKADNKVEEGTENFSYKKIAKNIFFLNWIEKDGTTISQVIDCNRQQVSVYLSYSDNANGRGGRNGILIEGKFHLKE